MTGNRPTSPMPAPVPNSLAPHTRVAGPAKPVAPAEVKGVPHAPDCLDSKVLLRGNSSVEITHQGTVYRLQATRQGKLILTK